VKHGLAMEMNSRNVLEVVCKTGREACRWKGANPGDGRKIEDFLNAPTKETNPLSNPPLLIQVNG
jgi:hypothetical protein